MNADRALGVIGAAIAVFALAFVGSFAWILAKYRDRPAGAVAPKHELVAIVPTLPHSHEEQPVARSFDQIAGMLAGLDDLGVAGRDFAIRAEYVPASQLEGDMASSLVHDSTRIIIGPGPSSDVQRYFIDRCVAPACTLSTRPLLLISSTSSALRESLTERYNQILTAVKTNHDIARVMADAIEKWIKHHPDQSHTIAIDFNAEEVSYSTELRNELVAELGRRGRAPDFAPNDADASIRVLIGNENWWLKERVRLDRAQLVVLADGLNSRATVANIRGVMPPETTMVCVKARTRDAIAAAGASQSTWEHIDETEFAWHNIARAAVRQVVSQLAANKPPVLAPVGFQVSEPQ